MQETKPKIKIWISALRLRTLPLSWAGIIMGSAIAMGENKFNFRIFLWALITASLYQILSNLANDYGDGIKGTDVHRVGPQRGVGSGLISASSMKKAVWFTVFLAVISTIILLKIAFKQFNETMLVYFILGLASVWAAVKYTVGEKAYGYAGWGDVFVLFFFGLVSVMGVYFLHTHYFNIDVILPAFSIGLLSVAVLNINNLRDLENDKIAGKITLPVRLGRANALKYHRALLILSFLFWIYFLTKNNFSSWQWLSLLPYVILFVKLKNLKTGLPEEYNKMLKKTSLLTFGVSILFFIAVAVD